MANARKYGEYYTASNGETVYWNGKKWQVWTLGIENLPGATLTLAPPTEAESVASGVPFGPSNDDDRLNTGKINLKPPSKTAASLGDKKFLKYPKEVATSESSDYIIFEFFDYNPPFGRGAGGDGRIPTDAFSGDATAGYKRYNESDVAKKPAGLASILLYMPEDISSTYNQKWGGADFSSFAAGLLSVPGTQVNLKNAIDTGIGQIKTTTYRAIQELTNNLSGSNISLNQVLGGISGTIQNPNTEMMYDGPNMRTFTLTFKLVSYSKEESIEIKRICNTFKKAMLPTFGGQAIFGIQEKAPNLLTIPKICQVSFMKGTSLHPYLSQYKTCAISDVVVNYTADGSYATYTDGGPVATQLKISFKEMKNIFAEEIELEGPSY